MNQLSNERGIPHETFTISSVQTLGASQNPMSEDRGFPKPGCPNNGDCQKLQLSEILGTFYIVSAK